MSTEKLYLSVCELVNAYERGLILSVPKKETETTPKILMMAQVVNMEAAVETGELGFGLSICESAKSVKDELLEPKNDNINYVSKKQQTSFYEECTIDGKHITGSANPSIIANKAFSDVDIDIGDMYSWTPKKTPKAAFGYKATNDFKYSLDTIRNKNITRYLNEKMGVYDSNGDGLQDKINLFGWKTNFGLENCLNCLVDFKLDLHIPSLEWSFDFKKILNKLKDFLKKMNAALDPTGPMLGICALLEALKNNGICPKNLPPLALIFPTLFTKYTFDLLNVRLSLSGFFLPLIKTVAGALVSSLENIPKLVNPILDCMINGLIGVNYLIKNYLSLADKAANQVTAGLNAFLDIPQKAKIVANDFSGKIKSKVNPNVELTLDFFKSGKYYEYKEAINLYNTITEEYLSACLILEEEINPFDPDYLLSVIEVLVEKSFKLMFIENLLNESLFETNSLGLISKIGNESEIFLMNGSEDVFSFKDTSISISFLKENTQQNFNFQTLIHISDIAILLENYIQKSNNDKKLFEELDKTDVKYRVEKKDVFDFRANTRPTVSKIFNSQYSLLNKINKKITDSMDPVLKPYGLNGKVNYVDTYLDGPTIKFKSELLKSYTASPVNQLLEKWINTLKTTKKFIKDLTGDLINSIKALSLYINETLDYDIQITGSILELLHLIRFVRVIWKLIQSGLTDCKKFKQNPKLVNSIIAQNYNNQIQIDTVVNNPLNASTNTLNAQSLFGQVQVTNLNNGKKYYLDPDECNGFTNVKINDENLDKVYNELIMNMHTGKV
jgi:hypothetical protein